MGEVLLFNIESAKAAKIKMLCRQLFIQSREVESDRFGQKLSYILGVSDDASTVHDSGFSEEMLYLSELNGTMFNIFLDQLKKRKTPVALKAVRTAYNIEMTPCELYAELKDEHEAFMNVNQPSDS